MSSPRLPRRIAKRSSAPLLRTTPRLPCVWMESLRGFSSVWPHTRASVKVGETSFPLVSASGFYSYLVIYKPETAPIEIVPGTAPSAAHHSSDVRGEGNGPSPAATSAVAGTPSKRDGHAAKPVLTNRRQPWCGHWRPRSVVCGQHSVRLSGISPRSGAFEGCFGAWPGALRHG